ncbi:MAG: FAD:protein FMN transferase, partial [Clostridia bacterium]|nr:FAD:protein FMN transferase [Clostridia bacterium]
MADTGARDVFSAMGTTVEVLLVSPAPGRRASAQAFAAVRRTFAEAEARFSRFLPDSELSRLNRSRGSPFRASPDFLEVLDLALTWRRRSGGLFDPCVLPALEAVGYDRPFAQLEEGDGRPAAAGGQPGGDTAWRRPDGGVELSAQGTVRLMPGV